MNIAKKKKVVCTIAMDYSSQRTANTAVIAADARTPQMSRLFSISLIT